MKSPPVEDMFAELESEDGEEFVLPKRNKAKIYYTRDQLLALRDSPLVKEPLGMSPSSEWFTPTANESYPSGYRSRQPQPFGEALSTPGRNTKRGSGRTPGESIEGEERLSFGRGLASSGRPRNLARRTDSGILGRNQTMNDDQVESVTPDRRYVDRGERKERPPWAKADAKDAPEGDATIMGRFAMKGALKLQTGDENDRETPKQLDSRESREHRSSDSNARRTADNTWRRTASGNADRETGSSSRRYGHHDEDHVPEWMMDATPSAVDATPSKQSNMGSARSGLDEIAAYRQAMKEREDRLAGGTGLTGRSHDATDETAHKPPGLFSDLTPARAAGSGTGMEPRTNTSSFLLPQAKAKVRSDIATTSISDPATPTGKGSRFARFFDPSASPAAAHSVPSPPQQSPHPVGFARQDGEPIVDKTQAFAALLGIKPASLAKTPQGHAAPAPGLHASPHPTSSPYPEIALSRDGGLESPNQSVDHMARLLGMLKSAQVTQSPAAPASPIAAVRSPPSAPLSPTSGSRFLAAMLNAEKPKQGSSPLPASPAAITHDTSVLQRQPQTTREFSHGTPGPTQTPYTGRPNQAQEQQLQDATKAFNADHRQPNSHMHRDMSSPAHHFAPPHMRPPGMDMMPPGSAPGMFSPPQIRPDLAPAMQQQAHFWQLAGDLPRGMPPPRMPIPGPPFPPMNMPVPPHAYGPYPPQNLPPGHGIPQMHPHPMGFGGPMPPGPPTHAMTPDAMSSSLMAILQNKNRPQA